MTKIDTMRTAVRQLLDDLGKTEKLLKKAVKEQKSSEKETNTARTALKSLQDMVIWSPDNNRIEPDA